MNGQSSFCLSTNIRLPIAVLHLFGGERHFMSKRRKREPLSSFSYLSLRRRKMGALPQSFLGQFMRAAYKKLSGFQVHYFLVCSACVNVLYCWLLH